MSPWVHESMSPWVHESMSPWVQWRSILISLKSHCFLSCLKTYLLTTKIKLKYYSAYNSFHISRMFPLKARPCELNITPDLSPRILRAMWGAYGARMYEWEGRMSVHSFYNEGKGSVKIGSIALEAARLAVCFSNFNARVKTFLEKSWDLIVLDPSTIIRFFT